MISDVVIVPGALLLLPEYQGRTPAVPGLLESCVAAVRDAVATAAHVVVVHATDRDPRSTRPAVGLRVADHLLAATHVGFSVEHVAVAWDASVEECVALGRAVASSVVGGGTATGVRPRGAFAPAHDAKTPPFAAGGDADGGAFASGGGAKARRTTVLVVADGSARRTEKAPGHLDPRSHQVDDVIVDAVRSSAEGGLGRLLELDPDLCADLLVAGRASLQVLAGAVSQSAEPSTDVTEATEATDKTNATDATDAKDATHATGASRAGRERAAYGGFEVVSLEVSDPFGVLYVVAHLARAR